MVQFFDSLHSENANG